MGAPTEISGFVLAGGRSSRLGRDKALLPWPPNAFTAGSSQTLLQHAIARLERVCATVSICANRDDLPFGGDVIPDAVPESGPLGGIVAALEHTATAWNFLLAVDLPFLPMQVMQALVAHALPSHGGSTTEDAVWAEALACVLPELDGLPQPLCGLYHRALAPGLRRALEAEKFKVMAALQEACTPAVTGAPGRVDLLPYRIDLWDAAAFAASLPSTPNPSGWFLNINTPEDWQQARQHGFE